MSPTIDSYIGCLLGLATGDALGAPHEGGAIERLVWRLIGRTSDGCPRWTDDTQMALDLAESLLLENDLIPDSLATRFASSYRWSRGYGPGTARILKRIRRGESWETATQSGYKGGSFGNGAAMRAPVLALFYTQDREELLAAARTSALVTHRHPLGIEGAQLIALAAHALLFQRTESELMGLARSLCQHREFVERLTILEDWRRSDSQPTPGEVARTLGNGIAAHTSCVTAIYIALRHIDRPFLAMMEFIIAGRGDTDTIGAMAGALWGIANGGEQLPPVQLEARDRLVDVATRLFNERLDCPAA